MSTSELVFIDDSVEDGLSRSVVPDLTAKPDYRSHTSYILAALGSLVGKSSRILRQSRILDFFFLVINFACTHKAGDSRLVSRIY